MNNHNSTENVRFSRLAACFELLLRRILKREPSREKLTALYQFIKFGIVGLSNTVIGYLIYVVSLFLLRLLGLWPSADIYIAQFIMFVLSVAWSFYWNNRAVFSGSDGGSLWRKLVKTYVSYSFTSLFLSEALLLLWVNVLCISEFIAPVLSLLITVPLNFILQKFWVFKA